MSGTVANLAILLLSLVGMTVVVVLVVGWTVVFLRWLKRAVQN